MALQFGFYDSLDGDRKYNAQQWSSIFDGIIRDGVFQAYGQAFNPIASGTNLSVIISSGRAWFNHTWFYSDGDVNNQLVLVWDAAHQLLPEPATTRIDAIVFRVDSRPSERMNYITVVKGPVSGNRPVYGEGEGNLQRSEYVNDYVLAFVTVQPGATAFTQSAIESNIGSRVDPAVYPCPFVTGPLEILDDNIFWQQWDTGFHEWMNESDASYNIWLENKRAQFETWRTEEQEAFYAWFQEFVDVLTPEQAANLLLLIQQNKRIRRLTLLQSGWELDSDTGWYTQTLSAVGMTPADNPILTRDTENVTLSNLKAYNKAYAIVSSGVGETGTDSVTFNVNKIPEMDVDIILKGV